MRLIHIVASNVGFRSQTGNLDRQALLDRLLDLTAGQQAGLLVLPGGFLTARDEEDMARHIEELGRAADRAGVAVIGGIDLSSPPARKGASGKAARELGLLPFFGFAVGPLTVMEPGTLPWRQTSTNNQNAWLVPDEDVPGEERRVEILEVSAAVLICGEIHSQRARTAMSHLGVRLVLDLGHDGMGNGLVPAMRRIAWDGGCAVAHSQHVKTTAASIHFVDDCGEQHSQPVEANELVIQGDLWAGWALREV